MQFQPFDHFEDNHTSGLKVRHRYCGFWLCPDCQPKIVEVRRKRIREGFKDLTQVIMLTLTVDRKLFAKPEDAYEHVVREKKLSRLVSYLWKHGQLMDQRYFAAMELHQDGWPHFHVLLNARFIDRKVVEKVLRQWVPIDRKSMDRPYCNNMLGTYTLNKRGLHLAAGYLSKAHEGPIPDWILSRGGDAGRLQFTFSSRGFSNDSDTGTQSSGKHGPPRGSRISRGPAAGRSYGERQALCRREVSLSTTMTVSLDHGHSITRERFVATLELTDKQAEFLASWTEWTGKGYCVCEESVEGLIEALESESGEPVKVQRVGMGFEPLLSPVSS